MHRALSQLKNTLPICLAVLSLTVGRAAEIHVATTGDDANPGSTEQPLATFAAAQALARTRAGLEPVIVTFHAGTYYLADTIHFTAADAGTAAKPVTYRAAAGETVALSGGNTLSGLAWTTHSGSIQKTTVPAGMVIDQLFANQVKQNLARYPDYDAATRVFNGYAADCISTSRAATWANPTGGYFHALHSGEWGGFHYRITGKNASNVVSYTGGQQNNRASSPHGTYRFVENIFEELNTPGEWFYNAATSTLYFHPPAGMDPSTAVMETAGRLKHLIKFDGTQAAPVKYVNLSGFIFRHAARTFMETYEPLLRSDWTIYRGAAVLLTGTEDCAISSCEFDQLGGNAVFFSNYNRRSSVTGSYFHDLGASGVCFVGNPSAVRNPLFNYTSPANSYSSIDKTNNGPQNDDYPADCLVENCLITGIGRVEKQPAGVQISMASRITVRHCSIYDCARAGINIGDGCWGGHVIEFCDTFDTVLETSDHGSFNSWGRDRFWNLSGATNSQLKAISLLDTYQPIILRNSRWQCDHGWDIDLDDGSSNYLIENNLLLNRGLKWREGFHRTGRNNVILNSSLHPHVWYPDSGDIFEKNIVSAAYQPAAMSSGLTKWGERLDYNLFPTEGDRTAYAAKGCDANPLSGSPNFVSPATGNYQVSAGSPALTLGFVNFPMNQFGVTTRPFTVNSKSITVRTPALIPSAPPVKLSGVFRWLGSQIKSVTTIEEASSFGTNPENGGVFFKGDYLGSAAAATGLLETDLIASINGAAVATVEDMVAALSATTGDVTFGIVRGQAPLNIIVPAASLSQAATLALESGVMTVPAAGISVDFFVLLGGLANGIGTITAGMIELQGGTVTVPLVSTGNLSKKGNDTAIVASDITSQAGADVLAGTLKLDQTISPPVKNGLILRLDASSADSLIPSGSVISRWLDADGNGMYAEQSTSGKSPIMLTAAQNGRPVMDFGAYSGSASGRSMSFKSAQGENLNLTTIRTAFWVIQGSNHLLTSATTYDFHRAGEGDTNTSAIWHSQHAHSNVRNGQTYLNGAAVNGTTTALANTFNLVSLVTTGNAGASSLCSDRTYRSGGQKIAEIILYNRALDSTERQNVETYLRHKWFAGPAPASTALAGADVSAGATLDLGQDFTHSQGTLTLHGDAQLNITGTLTNQSIIDIRPWAGALPDNLINEGTILTSSPYAHYRMGDGDPATNGGRNLPYDSSGNARHLATAAPGTPAISNIGGPNNDAYYTFNGTNQHYFFGTSAAWNPPEDNIGVEAWVRTSNLSQMDRHVFGTGSNNNGLNLGFTAGAWFGAVAGKAGAGSTGGGDYTAGTWIHIAVVRSAGITTFYANGNPVGNTTAVPNDASGTGALHMAVTSGGASAFAGDIAEARIFTFEAGTFDPNTDLLVTPVPPQVVHEQIVPTTAGTNYLLCLRVKPGAGESTVPPLSLSITGNAAISHHSLQTALPGGATEVPHFLSFTADSTTTTLRFTTLSGDAHTAARIASLEVAEPLTATPATVPNARQQAQIDRRYGLFLHFGVNTFNDLEWSDGTLPASSYQPTVLDVDQWVQTAYEAGMRYVLIISKHHDGFCMWDSPWTNYDVGSSSVPTNIIAAAAAACEKYGIKLALYYSLWDRHEPSYSNDAAYNQYMLRQLTELFENYGAIHELWLDGGWDKANTRWPSTEIYDLVRRLQPDCQVSTNWTIGTPTNVDQQAYPADQQNGYPIRYFPSDFRLGDPHLPKFPDPKAFSKNGNSYYLPFESTVTLSSQDRWFYHTGDSTNKSISALAKLYCAATAQDNILVFNAPPDRSGRVRDIERNTLFQLRDKLGLSAGAPLPKNQTGNATGTASAVWENDTPNYGPQRALDGNPDTRWACGPAGATSASFVIDFGAVRDFDRILIDEYEQAPGVGRITSFRLQAWLNGDWTTFHTGTTCARFSIHNFPEQSTSKVRLLIDSSTDAPSIWEFQINNTDHAFTSWRDQKFSPHGNSHPDYAWDGDPDGDGRINQMEFALNDDPNNAAPSHKIALRPSSVSGSDEFVFTAPVRNGATFTGTAPPTAVADGITYQVQGSHDLGSFNAPLLEVTPAESAGLPPLDEGWSYRSFQHATPGLPSGFFRMKTSR